MAEATESDKNSELLNVLDQKDPNLIKIVFPEILRNTGNIHVADKIEGRVSVYPSTAKHSKGGTEILHNLVLLCENLKNLSKVLEYLTENKMISEYDRQTIIAETTSFGKHTKLHDILGKKDLNLIEFKFPQILRNTGNGHLVDEIENTYSYQSQNKLVNPKIIDTKWWPDVKPLIQSLHKRKIGNKYLVEELHDKLVKDINRMCVILESEKASKYSGMGGVGKTLSTKWYAHTYKKEYDHIVWIDCGEDSLLKSFKKLAKELKIDVKDMIEVEEYATECHKKLSNFKCLWIYDNAESYRGEEGIQKVLPKSKENFYCLITSRSKEWGAQNIGFGKISELQLDIFSEDESLEFLKAHLVEEIQPTEFQLKQLASLLSNLPLALQLAVATLNNGKIDLQKYIDETSVEDTQAIVEETFDDYEKTINKNIKISMALILNEKHGKSAYNMLMIFGYIRPDEVHSKFLLKSSKSNVKSLIGAIDLLEKYCLVSRSGSVKECPYDDGFFNRLLNRNEQMDMALLSIHRLLQQVIRHNGKKTEKETLKKILSCKGYVDYKLIPYTKYADETLQKQFIKVKTELLDQEQLRRMVKQKRYEEAVQLAKFIDEQLSNNTTKYNYAICLEKNGQFDDCIKIMEPIFSPKKTSNIELITNLDILFGHLKKKKTTLLVEEDRKLLEIKILPNEKDVWNILLNSYLRVGEFDKAFTTAGDIIFEVGRIFKILAATQLPFVLKLEGNDVALNLDDETQQIFFKEWSRNLSSFDRLTPTELTIKNVQFSRNGQLLKELIINKILDLKKIKRLTVICNEQRNLSISLNDEVCIDYLELQNVKLEDWERSIWTVRELILSNIPFVEKTQLKCIELDIRNSSVDISCLPQMVEKLTLSENTKVFASGELQLQNLKLLVLNNVETTSQISNFKSLPIKSIHFNQLKEVSLNLPKGIQIIKITNYWNHTTIVGNEPIKINKLILEDFSLDEVDKILCHFETDTLVIYKALGLSTNTFVELANRKIKTIAVGVFNWKQEAIKSLPKHIDISEYYQLAGGIWKGVEKGKFCELAKL